MRIWPGRPYPLGATYDGAGVNFAVYSENATRVDVALFDAPDGAEEVSAVRLPEVTAHVWHGYVPGLKPGQLYGLRVFGPFLPEEGHRFNPSKLLIDPYARALAGRANWDAPLFPYDLRDRRADRDLRADGEDDAWGVPKAVVTNGGFDWGDDRPPRIAWKETIIYEAHVKGLTALHPDVPEHLRGTYAGLASAPVIEHFKKLNVTAVELMPVHAFLDDRMLVDRGASNYWGYNTLGYFAPEARYSSSGDHGQQVDEFKSMVRSLHAAGLEVILDVVYNHTAEGNHLGPTLSFRGIDNATYYRLVADQPRYYMDYTGTGNSLNMRHPQTIKLIMDSLRYWIQEMHVDGFRFDLAATLARELHEVDRLSAFFDVIHQDPIVSAVKLIAEPWDVGEGGYQVGNFPVLWTEWNGLYRDTVRRYWRGDPCQIGDLAVRLSGSSDLYQDDGRRPYASINLVCAHDGFTLEDLVSYNDKHNEANGEGNRDGHDDNASWNCGAEGPTDDPRIETLRERQKRNLIATLLLSQGVPMISGGDELSRTQGGNNNAYCQDNETSWYDWNLDDRKQSFLEFVQQLTQIRQSQPVLRRRRFFKGRRTRGSGLKDIAWFRSDGVEMSDRDWDQCENRCLAMRMAGDGLEERDEHGEPIAGDTLLVMANSSDNQVEFTVPKSLRQAPWQIMVDTGDLDGAANGRQLSEGDVYDVSGRSLVLLCCGT